MEIEKRQSRLQKNGEQTDKYMLRLFATVRKLEQLRNERKRLLAPIAKRIKEGQRVRRMSLEEIRERAAIGGDEFNDEIPS